jgi:PAS domain S-box-containing protein
MTGKPTYECLEAALRDSEERFSQLLEISPYSMAISRVEDGRYLLVNDAFCKNTGYSAQDIIGRTSAVFSWAWRATPL